MSHSKLNHLAGWMLAYGLTLLRLGIGLVFVWFGAPKLVAGLSPAEDLVAATVTVFDPGWFVPTLGIAEILIGLCLWIPRLVPVGLVLMILHMGGAALPLITLPEIAWKSFPVATLEGQYIIKNIVLVAGAIVLAGASLGDAARRAPAPRRRRAAVRKRPRQRSERTPAPLMLVATPRGKASASRSARSRAALAPKSDRKAALLRLARRAV